MSACGTFFVAAATLAGLTAWPVRARAEADLAWQTAITAAGGYTDNAGADPDAPVPSTFVALSPSLVVFSSAERTVHRASYGLSLSYFLDDTGASSVAHSLGWGMAHSASRRLDVALNLTASYQQANTAATDTAPGGGAGPGAGVNAVAGLDQQFLNVALGQGLSYELTPRWRLVQAAGLGVFVPITGGDGQDALTANLGLAAEHGWRDDSLGLTAAASFAHISGAAPAPDQDTLTAQSGVRWGHELSRHFDSELSAGLLVAYSPDADTTFAPVGSAVLAYTIDEGAGALTISRGAALNPLIGQVVLTDAATLSFGLPVIEDTLAASALAGVSHAETLLDDPLAVDVSVDVLFVDGGLAWRVAEGLDVSVRYQVAWQDSSTWDDTMMVGVPDLTRHVGLVVLSARYPAVLRPSLPFRSTLRMDRREDTDGPDARRPRR